MKGFAERRLRIALVHPHSWPEVRRGGERYLDDLAWYLARAGHRVDVITGTDEQASTTVDRGVVLRKPRHLVSAGLERRGIGRDETFGIVALPRMLRRRYDVVHAMTPTAALAARAAGQRTVFTVLGHPDAGHVRRNPKDRRLFRLAVRSATVAAALSQASVAAVRDLFGRDAVVLPPGIRIDRFPPNLEPRTGPPRVLFSAFAGDRRKGVQFALGALGRLLDRRPEARLVLSGAGDHTWCVPMLGEHADRILAATEVLGAGRLEDVPARYRGATVTVLPSTNEAFGLALVESLASGTPAVCSASGGMPEIVADPAVGQAVPHGDVDALADALDAVIDLAADPVTPANCVAAARRFDWQTSVGPLHEELYRSIAR